MAYAVSILMGYLLGCSGSGNLGASNATVLLGWKAGIAVALHDILKCVLAVFLARWLFPDSIYVGACAGVACVIGHIFPFYLRFRGGKGLASYFGLALALNWKLALLVAAVVILATLITDYISVGALGTIAVVPLYMGFATRDLLLTAILCTASLVMLYRHWENIVRIATGKEIGLRSTVRGDHRMSQKN